MLPVLLVDLGLALLAGGLASAVWLVAGGGLVLLGVGLFWPAKPIRLPGPAMPGLDRWIPTYQFGEHHETRIAAPAALVYDAVKAVTAREIRLFRLFTFLRAPRLPGRGAPSILNPAPDQPILEVATRTGFVLLHDEPGHEVVVGMLVAGGPQPPPRTPDDFAACVGSLARAIMGFHLSTEGGDTRLVTQTRIEGTDAGARIRFGAYWRLIYPGSALLRRTWLLAIKRRAEARYTMEPGRELRE